MNALLAMPLPIRLAMMALAGLCGGAAVNWAAYQLAWSPRPISPWSQRHPEAAPRRWSDRVPLVGWLGLRREIDLHGPGFWLRPMVVELVCAAGLAWLYWWEVENQALLGLPLGMRLPAADTWILHPAFFAHALLALLMLAASLIDIDEKIIPDAITIPGTLVLLVLVSLAPRALLPELVQGQIQPTLFFAPGDLPGWMSQPEMPALCLALACWWGWCLALVPRSWYPRHGYRRAIGLALARAVRSPNTRWLLALGVAGSLAIAGFWKAAGIGWLALVSSLLGMVAGGGLVWLVRIVGSAIMHREAMGFGDVTLMAMIGAALGWQAAILTFFIAPLCGAVIGLGMLLFRGESEIPYGPFLCVAAAAVVVAWPPLWNWAVPAFSLGLILPLVLVGGVGVMGLLLALIQWIKRLLGHA